MAQHPNRNAPSQVRSFSSQRCYSPTKELPPSGELWDGDEDDNGLLAALDVDLLSCADVQSAELCLELCNVSLELGEGVDDGRLSLGGLSADGAGCAEKL